MNQPIALVLVQLLQNLERVLGSQFLFRHDFAPLLERPGCAAG
jgi:hypothetical protein